MYDISFGTYRLMEVNDFAASRWTLQQKWNEYRTQRKKAAHRERERYNGEHLVAVAYFC